jgi:hypothetical protein
MITFVQAIGPAVALGLFGNRVRGGLYALPGGSDVARALGSLIGFGAVALLAGLRWPALAIAAASFVGCLISGADGKYGTGWNLVAFGRLWLYGIERLALVIITIAVLSIPLHGHAIAAAWLLGAILLCPVCYALAPYSPVAIPWLGIKARDGADSGFGEALFGAVMGALTLVACHGI